eukprot:1586907-Amphidinium_carterae.1
MHTWSGELKACFRAKLGGGTNPHVQNWKQVNLLGHSHVGDVAAGVEGLLGESGCSFLSLLTTPTSTANIRHAYVVQHVCLC